MLDMSSPDPERFAEGGAMLLAGLRRRHVFTAAQQGIAAQWREFLAAGDVPGRIGAAYYGAMCGSDATSIDYMCAVTVESFAGLPPEAGRMRVPAQRYAVFRHDGRAKTLASTWLEILAWLEQGRYRSAEAPDFELYPPGVDPLQPLDGAEVWVGVLPLGNPLA
jgi:AraC family transcriptional regulator